MVLVDGTGAEVGIPYDLSDGSANSGIQHQQGRFMTQINGLAAHGRFVTITNNPPYRQALFGEAPAFYTGPNCTGAVYVEVFETHLQSIYGGPGGYYVPDLSQTLGGMTPYSMRQYDGQCINWGQAGPSQTRTLPALPIDLNFQEPYKIVVRF